MSTTYKVIAGDTFDLISRKTYGVDSQGLRISGANPGVVEPLTPGASLVVPALPGAPENRVPPTVSSGVNETAITVNGRRFPFWTSAVLTRSIDSTSTFEFTAPLNASDPQQREALRPFTYPRVQFFVGGVPLFAGVLLGPSRDLRPDSKTVTVRGYSLPGVLEDCTLPAGIYPRNEFINQTLEDIARAIGGFFGLGVVFEADGGPVFPEVACAQDRSPLVFLADLAKQRNLVIGDTADGRIAFRQSAAAGVPVALLAQGSPPVETVSADYDHRQYFSHITGIEPVSVGATGALHTIANPHLSGVVRPHSFSVRDSIGGEVQPATQAKMGRMFANMASYSVTVSTWRDANGNLWEPNTTVQLLAPAAAVFSSYPFIVRTVIFVRDARGESATLDLIMPGTMAGVIPEVLPWDD